MGQADFAQALDVSPQALGTWEVGTRSPRNMVALAKRIELAFNVPASWVLGLDGGGVSNPHPDGPEGLPATGQGIPVGNR